MSLLRNGAREPIGCDFPTVNLGSAISDQAVMAI
jgi:hypothetical protein